MKWRTHGLWSDHTGNILQKFVTRFPSRKFCFFIGSICWRCFGLITAQGQNVVVPYTVRFCEQTKTVFQITDPFAEFTPSEKVKLRPVEVKDSIIREVNEYGQITSTIYHLENSQLEDWMSHPAKTVITEEATIMTDAKDNVLLNLPHSEKYFSIFKQLKAEMNNTGKTLVPQFIYLTDALTKSFIDSGYVLSDDSNGNTVFKKDSIHYLFNNKMMTTEKQVYSSNGELYASEKNGFKINPLGQTVPSFTIENKTDERFLNHCVHQVNIITYPSYIIEYPKYRSGGEALNEMQLAPNPVDATLNVELPEFYNSVQVTITDNTGRLIYQMQFSQSINEFVVDVQKFEKGMYVIAVTAGDKLFTRSFIKN